MDHKNVLEDVLINVTGAVIAIDGRDPTIAIAAATNALENNIIYSIALSSAAELVYIGVISAGIIDQAVNGHERAEQVIAEYAERDGTSKH